LTCSLAYFSLANAVARHDNLEFLSDVVPRTTTYRKYIEQRGVGFRPGDPIRAEKAKAAGHEEAGIPRPVQSSIPRNLLNPAEEDARPAMEPSTVAGGEEMDVDEQDDSVQEQLAMEMSSSFNRGG